MINRKNSYLWIFLSITLLLGLIWQFYPLPTAQGRLNRIPLNGPGFTGQDVPLTPSEAKFFKNINLIKRLYEVKGRYYFVTILDGSNNRHIVHDPYYCFRGSGWEIMKEHRFPLEGGEATLIDIHKDQEQREALYFFSDGKQIYSSPMHYWIQTTLRRLSLGASGEEPVLIMIQPTDTEAVDWTTLTKTLSPLFVT